MATLQSYVDLLNPAYKARYSSGGHFVIWANQLLGLLTSRGILSENRKEAGVIVNNKRWITIPADAMYVTSIYCASNMNAEYRFEQCNGKLRLLDYEFEDEEDLVSCSAFTNSATTGITVNVTGYDEDDLENYLFYITEGDMAGCGIVLSGNADSGITTTDITYLHNQDAALGVADVTAARLVSSNYYVMLKYVVQKSIAAISDEMPIGNNYESELVEAWLRYKCASYTDEADPTISLTLERKFNDVLNRVMCANRSKAKPIQQGRRLIGLESCL